MSNVGHLLLYRPVARIAGHRRDRCRALVGLVVPFLFFLTLLLLETGLPVTAEVVGLMVLLLVLAGTLVFGAERQTSQVW